MLSRSIIAPMRSLFSAAVLGCAMLLLAVPGCGRQTEGERCDIDAGREGADSDCEDGLICTRGEELGNDSADICCPPSGATEPACIPVSNPVGSGGAGGGTTSTGGMSAGGSSAGGMSAGGNGGSATSAGGMAAGGSATGGSATGGSAAGGSATGGNASGGAGGAGGA